MINEKLKFTGHVTVTINGSVVQEIPNLVVTAGKSYITSRMKDASAPTMSHMAVGTSTTTPSPSNTTLGTEVARVTIQSIVATDNIITYAAQFPAGTGTAELTEAAILNSNSGGTMLCRTVFGVVSKGLSDAMTITWAITAS